MKTRKRNRKIGFDYSSDAIYFLTNCCKNRIHFLGEIENQQIILNEFGVIAEQQIKWLIIQYPYFEILNFVIMPNHIHILAQINSDNANNSPTNHANAVGTGRDLSTEKSNIKIKSVSEIMGAFQTTTSKKIHSAGKLEFGWQRSFHDHIVRNSKTYDTIFNYISENPEKWDDDTFNDNKK